MMFALQACNQHQNEENIFSSNIPLEVDLTKDISERDFLLSDIASDIEYIPLESNIKCYISMIHQVDFGEEYFLIHDRMLGSLFMFKRDGSFVGQIGNLGKGPEEIVRIQCFSMDEKKGEVYIVTHDKKVKTFSLQGDFISSFSIRDYPFDFLPNGNSFLAVYPYPYKIMVGGYLFKEINNKGEVQNSYCRQFNDHIKLSDPIKYARTYRIDDTISFWERYNDTVIGLKDKAVYPRVVFNLDEPHSGEKKYNKIAQDDFDSSVNLWGFLEIQNYFFLSISDCRKVKFTVFDKRTKDLAKTKPVTGVRGYGYINDLDGGYPFWPSYYSDGYLYEFVEVETLKEILLTRGYLEKSDCMYPDKKAYLKSLIKGAGIDSNPILVKVKLK